MQLSRPLLLITMGDVAGVGPEIIARAWPTLPVLCRPVVVGDPLWLRRGLDLAGVAAEVVSDTVEATPTLVPCLRVPTAELADVQPGRVDARAGRAAHDFLCAAIDRSPARPPD